MDFPPEFQPWGKLMSSKKDSNEQKILTNLKDDNCIKKSLQKKFCRLLIQKLQKGKPKNPQDAHQKAFDVIKENNKIFTCSGKKVTLNNFDNLVRFQKPSSIKYLLPDRYLEIFFKMIGLSESYIIDDISLDDLYIILEQYDGPIVLGKINELEIVWVSSENDCSPLFNKIEELIDRLGLTGWEEEENCLIIKYKNNSIKSTLHIPRAFDGIGNSQFKVETNCKAKYGKTKPLTKKISQGLSEAIHRKCEVEFGNYKIDPRPLL